MYESSSQRERDLVIDATKKSIDTTDVDKQMFTQPLDNIF